MNGPRYAAFSILRGGRYGRLIRQHAVPLSAATDDPPVALCGVTVPRDLDRPFKVAGVHSCPQCTIKIIGKRDRHGRPLRGASRGT